MMKKSYQIISLFAASAAFSVVAQADLTSTLVQKGLLTQDEAQAVRAELATPAGTVPTPSVVLEANAPHTTALTFSGLLQTQYTFASVRDRARVGTPAALQANPSQNQNFYIPAARVGVKATLPENWEGMLNLDFGSFLGAPANNKFAGSTAALSNSVEKMYVKKAFDMATISAAYQKVQFGHEYNTDESMLSTTNRSAVTNYFSGPVAGTVANSATTAGKMDSNVAFGGRYLGVSLTGSFEGFMWGAAVTNNYQGFTNPSAKTANMLSVHGNLGYTGSWDEFDFTVGVNLGFNPEGNSTWAATLTTNGAAAATLPTGRNAVFAWNPFMSVKWQDFTLMVELLGANVEKGRMPTDTVTRTKDAKPMGLNVVPTYRFNETWEVVGRFAYLDTDKRGASIANVDRNLPNTTASLGNLAANTYKEVTSFYGGFNYYVLGNDVKLSGGYEYSMFKNQYSVTTTRFTKNKAFGHNVSLRAQLQF